METSAHYKSYNIDFQCLDQRHVLEQADVRVLDPSLANLVVDYGPNNAWCGWNFDVGDAGNLIESWTQSDAQGFKTRWIMLFNAHKQQEFVLRLLDRYKLSARLRASLLSAPGEGNLEIAKRLWHWSSVEHGDKFRAVGYNSLFSLDQLNLPSDGSKNNAEGSHTRSETRKREAGETRRWWDSISSKIQQHSNKSVLPTSETPRQGSHVNRRSPTVNIIKPKSQTLSSKDADGDKHFSGIHYHPRMLRLWMWIIVTDDGTIISIHEPFPVFGMGYEELDRSNAEHIRRNLRMVLRCLSEERLPLQVDTPSRDIDVAIEEGALVVRKTNGPTGDLLLYYLFDDWYTTWGIVVQRAHPYSKDLNHIKEQDPQLVHIDKLHDIVRRLASLKRIYQSYELVLERLLQEGKAFFDENSPLTFRPVAASRLARLKYRIRYLAITEIEDCELETQGLISLTYNRLNFRETRAVEKLALLSLTLAKVTIIFLPLSLIMAYFSMDVEGISGQATKKDFWISAGVTLFLTFCFLLLINRLSKALERKGSK
ncbi:uncharacterized protein DFL_001426 [Arthrobotrys flagrans]|uniref:Uncharacterized protein n=1 Tax=Arthrobotrys flagrans TaxID=97331 RepID=A0A437A7L8_ARTFL|nr:hypothetical protein DFL_001426 [Arthrobotrys flagrans]